MTNGRNRPCLIVAAKADGSEVELVVKFVAGCERGKKAMIAEALAAMLATDLGLPVPECFLVQVDRDFADSIQDYPDAKKIALASVGPNFGSATQSQGFVAWSPAHHLQEALLLTAAEILAFDVFIQNPDRQPSNPNCLTKGNNLVIFDHELALITEGIIGWRAPWQERGALEAKRHLFYNNLLHKMPALTRFREAIAALTDERLGEYGHALPQAWLSNPTDTTDILGYIGNLRVNLEDAMGQLAQVMK